LKIAARIRAPFLVSLLLLGCSSLFAKPDRAPRRVPRTILALYDSTYEREVADSPIHQIVEMPLNHLGLVVRYYDINQGLPRAHDMQDVRGVLTWFQSNAMVDPLGYLAWANSLIDSGTKFVIIGELSASRDFKNNITPVSALNRFWARLGIRSEEEWTRITYDLSIIRRDSSMIGFERPLEGVLPQFAQMKKVDPNAISYLTVRKGSDPRADSDLVVTNRNGGYIAGSYAHHYSEDLTQRQWYVNPFEFFKVAFDTGDLPKPDTTTLMGRRIFYSHVDGDGWRNLTEVTGYRSKRALSAEVILNEVIRAFPDLPFTVAPIAADLDPVWYGTPSSLEVAKRILALPNVEAGTHTYSHPLDWKALVTETGTGSVSRGLLTMGLEILPSSVLKLLSGLLDPSGKVAGESRSKVHANGPYEKARTYDLHPFDLDNEIRGSAAFITRLLPPGKRVEIVQWSGDTTPFDAVVAASRAAGFRNINGGETRFDEERLSYGWVSPVGRQVGGTWQIYASNSNENNYTELWTDRFFGFRYLTKTINNTEAPRRVKPINVYFHMYSGEKLSSLRALVENLRYASSLEVCPITAGQYAAVADGFYSASMEALGSHIWRISNRGELQTIRFDDASRWGVDFTNSTGVVGQRHEQDQLYVALDAADPEPVIALRLGAATQRPFLVQSRWRVSNVHSGPAEFSFTAAGYGTGGMQWKLPSAGHVTVKASNHLGRQWQKQAVTDSTGLLELQIPLDGQGPVLITISAHP
jgi:hypothetical protein